MGQRTDARIREWQAAAGLEPATGSYAALLADMSRRAFELVKVIELERSGIRDGDGQWHGADPIAGLVHDLQRLEVASSKAWKAAKTPEPEMGFSR